MQSVQPGNYSGLNHIPVILQRPVMDWRKYNGTIKYMRPPKTIHGIKTIRRYVRHIATQTLSESEFSGLKNNQNLTYIHIL
ncbi:hypothetical protein ACT3CD_00115 [Geofilum sp. OHC36d9]|uniref:hypothetical protein n=1 Tax=Geofilum sp. OHC36d9 TaxID=3458413 RepID=UPI0040349C48